MFIEKLTDEQIMDITKKMLLASGIKSGIVNQLTGKKFYVTRFHKRIDIVAVCCDWCRFALQLKDFHCLIGIYKRNDLDTAYTQEMYKIFGKEYLIAYRGELKKEWSQEVTLLEQKIEDTNKKYNNKIKEIQDIKSEEDLSK